MNRLILVALLACFALPASAAGAGGMFRQGQTHFMLEAGSGTAFNSSYTILGAGVTHYVADGLGVGLSYESWSGGGPGITKISPSVQYVFAQASAAQPFIGGFYRHATIAGLPSINSLGVRAGAYIATGSNAAIGLALVYESYQDCQAAVYSACNESYPEVSFTFGF